MLRAVRTRRPGASLTLEAGPKYNARPCLTGPLLTDLTINDGIATEGFADQRLALRVRQTCELNRKRVRRAGARASSTPHFFETCSTNL